MRLPIPTSGEYQSTRLPIAIQQNVNVYSHTVRGKRQFPGLVQFGDLTAIGSAGRGAINMAG